MRTVRLLDAVSSCRVCGGTDHRVLGSKVSAFSGIEFRLSRCRSCSFTFVDPLVDPRDVYDDDYYKGRGVDPLVQYEDEYNGWRGTIRQLELEDLLSIASEHLRELAGRCPDRFAGRPVKWLDYGCGAGGLLRFLGEQGGVEIAGQRVPIEAYGADVGAWVERLRQRGERIIDETALGPYEGTFDVVSCIEVLEHVVDPNAIVETLARVLAPGGLLLLTTGNLASPLAKLMGFRFPYCIPEIHISLFNPDLLTRLYRQAQLEPLWRPMRGILKFKVMKNLPAALRTNAFARWLSTRAPALWFFDSLFGVSRMPFASKPLRP